MSSYGAPQSAGDDAAHALSSLSLNKDREHRYDATHGLGEGPPSSYPPPVNPSSTYSSQGLPYLASPISGVVSGGPYTPPSPSYNHPPPYDSQAHNKSGTDDSSNPLYRSTSAPEPGSYPPPGPYPSNYPPAALYALNLPENLDVSSAGKEKIKESSYPQYHGGPPTPNTENYPPALSAYPPEFNESNTGQVFPSFSPYEATSPAPAVPYPQPEGYDGQGKQKAKNEFDSSTPSYGSSPSFPGSDSPQSGYPPQGGYAPDSGQHALPVGHPSQHTLEQGAPTTGYPAQIVKPGEVTSESTVSSSSEGGADGEKGFKLGHQFGFGGYPQHGYAQPGYPQPGYGQPAYPQPGYEAYPSHGYAPSYPPAYPGHGYTPEAYPSHGYGAPGYVQPYGYGGDGGSHHAPAPYGAYGGAHYGSPGHYKQHKGGHKGYKHKKMKKMKKGHYLHFQQPGYYGGQYGGHYGGHHGGHGKHGKHKY